MEDSLTKFFQVYAEVDIWVLVYKYFTSFSILKLSLAWEFGKKCKKFYLFLVEFCWYQVGRSFFLSCYNVTCSSTGGKKVYGGKILNGSVWDPNFALSTERVKPFTTSSNLKHSSINSNSSQFSLVNSPSKTKNCKVTKAELGLKSSLISISKSCCRLTQIKESTSPSTASGIKKTKRKTRKCYLGWK